MFIFAKNKIINLDHVTAIEKMEKGDNQKVKIRFANGHILHIEEEYINIELLASKLSAINSSSV